MSTPRRQFRRFMSIVATRECGRRWTTNDNCRRGVDIIFSIVSNLRCRRSVRQMRNGAMIRWRIEANGTLGGEGWAGRSHAMVFKFMESRSIRSVKLVSTNVGGYTEQGWLYWDRAAWFRT